jgi:hypothetical protein
MKRQIEEHITSFQLLMENCRKTGYIVRDRHYHELFGGMLKNFLRSTTSLKETMIQEKDEEAANTLLAIECFCEALRAEMFMWLALKKEDPNKAWGLLIDAQEWAKSSADAMFIPRLQQDEYIERLHEIEKVVFPPQVFNSPGMIVRNVQCSICKQDYEKCHHIAGKAYMGKFCIEEVTKIESFLHMAFVTYPYNKRARITRSAEGEMWKDYMTWKVTRDPKAAANGRYHKEQAESDDSSAAPK